MSYCAECGTQLAPQDRFCGSCGADTVADIDLGIGALPTSEVPPLATSARTLPIAAVGERSDTRTLLMASAVMLAAALVITVLGHGFTPASGTRLSLGEAMSKLADASRAFDTSGMQ